MKYQALASDGDGTLTRWGLMAAATRRALARLRASGRRLILVTGETGEEIASFPHVDLFDRVVAENGALLYRPDGGRVTALARRPARLAERLRARGVWLRQGRVVLIAKRT